MTDRVNGLTVVLEREMRDDDVEGIVSAIQQLRGVASVHTIIARSEDFIARQQVAHELRIKLFKILE